MLMSFFSPVLCIQPPGHLQSDLRTINNSKKNPAEMHTESNIEEIYLLKHLISILTLCDLATRMCSEVAAILSSNALSAPEAAVCHVV